MKPAYKLQEFVAHASNVNCLKIGKKSSRVLVTGGEDHKVNIWAIGKPNAILSLSGHSSAVESVAFDAAEVLVLAGAASGTIKLWDLEEAKIVRTLTGHRSNCITVDFHPFGEFFASGSLDTNLKIWDIRRKGCIHSYKGHTRGINAIKFSPDGRWVVSGGEDNVVKLWDLTAGKLMHDFKYHDGQITCLDFHPHEFLLATGSADRTVKFWDLETFESIGSAGPEAGVVRSLIFNPDGRTLLCGLQESLKVFSWEPIRCHDVVDVSWSKLADLSVHEGKLLGCSYNQSCVGIWVVDLSRIGAVLANGNNHSNVNSSCKSTESISQPAKQVIDGGLKSGSVIKDPLPGTLESSLNEVKISADNVLSTPQKVVNLASTRVEHSTSVPTYVMTPKRVGTSRSQSVSSTQQTKMPNMPPVIVPSNGAGMEKNSALEPNSAKVAPSTMSSNVNDVMIKSTTFNGFAKAILKTDLNCFSEPVLPNLKSSVNAEMGNRSSRMHQDTSNLVVYAACDDETDCARWLGSGKFRRTASAGAQRDLVSRAAPVLHSLAAGGALAHSEQYTILREPSRPGYIEGGKLRNIATNYERKEKAFRVNMGGMIGMRASLQEVPTFMQKGNQSTMVVVEDANAIEELMQQHGTFTTMMQSRFAKLQVVRRFWTKNDMKGAVEAMGKMTDNAVIVDVLSVLIDRTEVFTLEICTLLLPFLNGLLSSDVDRYLITALAVLSLLVRNFGNIIHTTRIASPSFGVDLHAEQRLERCNSCFAELQNVAQSLIPLLRKGGEIGKAAQDLSIALQEV